MTMLMDYTDEGRTRIEEITTDGLVFQVTHIAYGSSGYNAGTPTLPLALVPAATALVAEVYRAEIPSSQISLDEVAYYRGKETVYTTVSGNDFSSILGEAGLIATVVDPGTTGLAVGYEFLLAQAHFPRVVLSVYGRLAINWPLDFEGPGLLYTSYLSSIGGAVSIFPTVFGPGFASYALVAGTIPPGLALNAGTGEISGTLGVSDLLGGTPAGVWSGIQIEADGGPVVSPVFAITVNGAALPEPLYYNPMEIDTDIDVVFDGSGTLPAVKHGPPTLVTPTDAVDNAVEFDSANGDYLLIGHDAALDIGTSDYTIAGLTLVEAVGLTQSELFNKIDISGANPGIGLTVQHNTATAIHGDGSGAFLSIPIGFASIDDGAMHSIVLSGDRDVGVELFVDGVSAGTSAAITAQASSVSNTEDAVQGGVNNAGPSANALSQDDEVAVWDSALDVDQAATLRWLQLRGQTIGSWVKGNGPSKPGYPVLTNAQIGVALSLLPTGPSFDGEGDTVTYIEYTELPNGTSLNSSTGEISGTPTGTQVGSGASASMAAAASGTITVTGLTGMTPYSPGRKFHVYGTSDPDNTGIFEILTYVSSTSVIISDNGVAPGADGNNGSLTWEEHQDAALDVRVGVSDGMNLVVSDVFTITVS